MTEVTQKPSFKYIMEIGPDIYNIRGPFKMFMGILDVGVHMTLVRLSNGKFLVLDLIDVTPDVKKEIDELTDNGTKIEAVLGTHPFHTSYFRSFYNMYPDAKYYGCPRHLKVLPDIPWKGDLNDEKVRKLWEPEIEMRIPAGSEFVNPLPEDRNHFSNVFVFHKKSKTIHNNDTIVYSDNPGFLLSLAGWKHGNMFFHYSLTSVGLLPTPDAPRQFKEWVQGIIRDWDFDNILTAHNGNKLGGAKEQLIETLQNTEEAFNKLIEERLNAAPEECKSCGKPYEHVCCG